MKRSDKKSSLIKSVNASLTAAIAAVILFANPGLCAAVSFTPQTATNGGDVIGRIPIAKFGSLVLPRGRAYFKTNVIEVTAIPEYQFDRQIVLSGPILKCWSSQDGKTASINGIAYFQDGDWLKYVDENSPDNVITAARTYSGQITALKSGYIEVTPSGGAPQKVAVADVLQVVSPRAYTFSMPVTAFSANVKPGEAISGESSSVTIKPSSKVITLAAVKHEPLMKGDGDVSNTKLIALWASLAAVEAAQFIPLAILEGPIRRELVQQYHGRMNQYYAQANLATIYNTQYPLNSSTAPGANPYTSMGNFTQANYPIGLGF
jgi:hypothetical protein